MAFRRSGVRASSAPLVLPFPATLSRILQNHDYGLLGFWAFFLKSWSQNGHKKFGPKALDPGEIDCSFTQPE
jgi:hypothetical protein